MIIGLFLRHYKIYKGATYIPFGFENIENLNLFIGQNGAGKSSILEALDTFFNNRPFTIHNTEKKSEAFVAPLFMISESELEHFDTNSQIIIKEISKVLFDLSESQSPTNYKPYKSFFEQKTKLFEKHEKSYMFLFGFWPEQDKKDIIFITFHEKIRKKITALSLFNYEPLFKKAIAILKANILNYYSYQYIPVETSIDDFLRLESKGMQELMSESVKNRIEKTLNQKLPNEIGKSKDQSILDIVNNDLEIFVNEVEVIIQEIDKEYDFERDFKSKTKITANHLTDVVIEAFFSKRTLKKSKKPVKSLSAGERKKALIDIAFAFLTQDTLRQKKVILAVDEPESSLHISMCYDQFERLDKLANHHNVQLFVTTHWYGSLPIIEKGNLFHVDSTLEESPKISEFSFRNYFEERGNHPNDVQFKSFFDLASAIISSLRVRKNNWLIVESEEDKKYIEKHISNTDNLKILPVGGCAIVKLLYDYLYVPISQKSDAKDLQGRIFCLIDTDLQGVNNKNLPEDLKNKLLKIRRLQYIDANQKVDLVKLDTNISSPTEIEETLNPKAFYESLKLTIEESSNEEVKTAFSKFAFDIESKNSFIRGDNSIIYPSKMNGTNPKEEKIKIINFIDNNKKIICENYCKQVITDKPSWIKEIDDFFK